MELRACERVSAAQSIFSATACASRSVHLLQTNVFATCTSSPKTGSAADGAVHQRVDDPQVLQEKHLGPPWRRLTSRRSSSPQGTPHHSHFANLHYQSADGRGGLGKRRRAATARLMSGWVLLVKPQAMLAKLQASARNASSPPALASPGGHCHASMQMLLLEQ